MRPFQAFFAAISASVIFLGSIPFAAAWDCPSPWMNGITDFSTDCVIRPHQLRTWIVGDPRPWVPDSLRWVTANIRSGYLPENPRVPFRGNVIYYEGLGDSMLNHAPLFGRLTDAGYRVIAFDYMGQGGSSGSMDDTRVLEIRELGNRIWNIHARDLEHFPRKNIIGWSTGGLAAYVQASFEPDLNSVVLMAPGIAPNLMVGEQNPWRLRFNQIPLASLTRQTYRDAGSNPHHDPIRPRSPTDVPHFAMDLLGTADAAREFRIARSVEGFVLLSGDEDTYVDARKTREILRRSAPHFSVLQYRHTLHEIDNEAEPARSMAHDDIVQFLHQCNP